MTKDNLILRKNAMQRSTKDMVEETASNGEIVSNSDTAPPAQDNVTPVMDTTACDLTAQATLLPTLPSSIAAGHQSFNLCSPVAPPCNIIPTYGGRGHAENQRKSIILATKRVAPAFRKQDVRKPSNEQSELLGKPSFSDAFVKAIGHNNVTNTIGPEDTHLRVKIFEALVEAEALRATSQENNPGLNQLSECVRYYYNGRFSFSSGQFEWSIFFNGKNLSGKGLVSLIKVFYCVSRRDATWTLANILGMDIDKMFKTYPVTLTAEVSPASIENHIPQYLWHYDEVAQLFANCIGIENIYGHAGQIIGGFVMYQCEGIIFCLMATVGNKELCIGHYQANPFFFNQHLMDRHTEATIIFCADMRAAIKLNRLIVESKEVSKRDYIAVACLGDKLVTIAWGYLQFRKVVYVPAPTKVSMALVKGIKAKCEEVQVEDFKVYPFPLLHSPRGDDDTCNLVAVERELMSKAVVLDGVERVAILLRKITCEAMTYDDYQAWGRQQRIFKLHGNAASLQNSIVPLDQVDYLAEVEDSPSYDFSKGFDWRVLLCAITLLLGHKDRGKSLCVLACIKQMLGSAISYLFDFETLPQVYKARLMQLGLFEHRGTLFHDFCKLAVPPAHPWSNFVLTDSRYQDEARQEMIAKGATLAAFDNVMAGGSGLSKADTDKAAGSIMSYATALIKDGIGSVVVHHLHGDKNPEASGGAVWNRVAHNIIHLIGKEEILNSNLGTPEVQAYANADGATFGLYVIVCKAAPTVAQKVFWYHLGEGHSEWQYLGHTKYTDKASGHSIIEAVPQPNADELDSDSKQPDNVDVSADLVCTTSADAVSIVEDVPAGSTSMNHKARKVLEEFAGKDVLRKDIDAFLRCSENTSRKVIADLIRAGHADVLDKNTGLYRFK